MKVLLDTNIIVDNLAGRDEFEESRIILENCESGSVTGIVSTVTIMDVIYILRKYLNQARIREAVQMLMQIVDVASVHRIDITNALAGGISDIEDAVQASVALRNGADYIITRNAKDFAKSPLTALTPDAFLHILHNVTSEN